MQMPNWFKRLFRIQTLADTRVAWPPPTEPRLPVVKEQKVGNFRLCIPTMNNYQGVIDLIRSAECGWLKPKEYIIVDNGGKFRPFLESLSLDLLIQKLDRDGKIVILNYGKNLGVAKSWNEMLNLCFNDDPYCIVANDDVTVNKDTLECLVSAAHKDTSQWVWHTENQNPFCLFLIRKEAVDRENDGVGYFDEKFYPAYYEDSDYAWRLRQKDKVPTPAPGAICEHGCRTTYKLMSQEDKDEAYRIDAKLKAYYLQKWGGLPGKEKYKDPYNGQGWRYGFFE